MWESEERPGCAEGARGGIVLDIILPRDPILIVEHVIDIGDSLVDLGLRIGALYDGVISYPQSRSGIRDLGAGDQVLPIRFPGLEQGQRHRADLGGRDGFSVRALDGVHDALRAAVVGESERHGGGLRGDRPIGDADALIRQEIKQLVFLNRPAQRSAELVAGEEGHFVDNGRGCVVEERRSVHVAVLELFVDFAVQLVSTGLGQHADVRSAIGALRGVVHGGVHGNLLDRLGRRCGKGLADGAVHRGAGLQRAARAKILTGVQSEAVLAHLAGGVSIEQIVGAYAVQRKAVAGVALPIGEDGLIAEAGVAARTPQKIRVNPRTHDRQLREAARAERRLLDRKLIDNISGRGVHLVHQRRADHVNRRRNRTDSEVAVDRSGSVAIDDDLSVGLCVEAFLRKREFVRTCRKVGDGIRPS